MSLNVILTNELISVLRILFIACEIINFHLMQSTEFLFFKLIDGESWGRYNKVYCRFFFLAENCHYCSIASIVDKKSGLKGRFRAFSIQFETISQFKTMKINILYLTVLLGICFASAEELVPWTSVTKTTVIYSVPYKFDEGALLSNRTKSSVSSALKHITRKFNTIKYKTHENEHIYLLITTLDKCTSDRVNNVSHPNNVVAVCLREPSTYRSSSTWRSIYEATKAGITLNQMTFYPGEVREQSNENHNNEDAGDGNE